MQEDTTTKFIGDIVFNNGDKDISASDLVTKEEVNEIINTTNNEFATNSRVDSLFIHAQDIVNSSDDKCYQLLTLATDGTIENVPNYEGACSRIIFHSSPEFTLPYYDFEFEEEGAEVYCYRCTTPIADILKVWYQKSNSPHHASLIVKKHDEDERAISTTSISAYIKVNQSNDSRVIPTVGYVKQLVNESTPTIDLSGYVQSSTLNDYATTQWTNNNFPTYTHIQNNYVKSTDLNTILSSYVQTSTLTDYVANDRIADNTSGRLPIPVIQENGQWRVNLKDEEVPMKVYVESPEEHKGEYIRKYYSSGLAEYVNESLGNYVRFWTQHNGSERRRNALWMGAISPEDTYNCDPEVYYDGEMSTEDKQTHIPTINCVESMISSPSNTTITHYTPIEESMNSINDFIIGSPVYLTGNVYKYDKQTKIFTRSTINDTTDCICSVKTNGNWTEFVGICVRIDEENKCITFASGGDYLVRVNDTLCYKVGDEVFVDGDNELKIISGQTAITSKIRRTLIGIITSIINEHYLAVFKS